MIFGFNEDEWNSSFDVNAWQIYPNPSNGQISIKSNFVKEGDMLYIYSMMGTLLGKFILNENGKTDISSIKSNHNLVLVQWFSGNEIKGTHKLLLK